MIGKLTMRRTGAVFCVVAVLLLSVAQNSPRVEAQAAGKLEVVGTFGFPMPIGIAVSKTGRMFSSFPRWTDKGSYTLAELVDGKPVPYPSAEMNRLDLNNQANTLVSVQGLVIDPQDRLWFLDTGSLDFRKVYYGGPKLIAIDLKTNQVVKKILFPQNVAYTTTYLNDLRLDLRRGAEGMAFITDSSDTGPNGIVVVDLATGNSWRKLNNDPSTKAENNFMPNVASQSEAQPLMARMPGMKPMPIKTGTDSIAISPDGSRLYYAPLASRKLYSVSTDALTDPNATEAAVSATVKDEGMKGVSDGMESDTQNRVYTTNFEQHAILVGTPGGLFTTLVQDPRMVWPDTLDIAPDGYLYIMTNELNNEPRYHFGRDLRSKQYHLFRIKVDAQEIQLTK